MIRHTRRVRRSLSPMLITGVSVGKKDDSLGSALHSSALSQTHRHKHTHIQKMRGVHSNVPKKKKITEQQKKKIAA